MKQAHEAFIAGLPKAELHLHIEGTLTPEMVWKLAARNGMKLPYANPTEIALSREFRAETAPEYLRVFLKAYFEGLSVLRTEQDFYEVTTAYLEKCAQENVLHAELSFDPQAHTSRGVAFDVVMAGIESACANASANLGVSTSLIMCINRDRDLDSAHAMYEEARPYFDRIAGLGLDSTEQGNPPIKFAEVYEKAHADGLRTTAHCDVDQENSVQHIWQCIDVLKVDRIDHGLNALEDPRLVDLLTERQVCLTPCPTWTPLHSVPRRVDRIRSMYDKGMRVTVNSDDPGLFASSTLGAMLPAVAAEGAFNPSDVVALMANAFKGAWLEEEQRSRYLGQLQAYAADHA